MNLYAGGRDRNRPEQATGDVPWIDRRHLRATLALVEIQSKQAESPFVLFPVNSDVVPLHEPHVSVKEKATGVTGTRVRSSPVARDMRHADEAVEVSNQGWLTAGSRKKEMEDFRSRAEGLDTSRNRVGAEPVAARTSRGLQNPAPSIPDASTTPKVPAALV